jgi:hypothetical protein
MEHGALSMELDAKERRAGSMEQESGELKGAKS